MKNTKVLLGLVLTVFTTFVFASDVNPEIRMEVIGNQAFSMTIDEAIDDLTVSFMDNNGTVLFNEQVLSGENYNRTFLLRDLPENTYSVKLVSESKEQIIPVSYSKKAIEIEWASIDYLFKPVISKKNDFVTLSMMSTHKTPVSIQILNEFGDAVFIEELIGGSYIGKKFDFSKVKGNYTMIVNHAGSTSTKTISAY